MSYTIFKKKLFVKTKDQRIMGFVYSADSSITRGTRGEHPAWWGVLNMGIPHTLFPTTEQWVEAANAEYQRQLRLLEESEMRYPTGKSDFGPESYTYSGDSFPGGRKMKNMKSFFSVRRAVPQEDFLLAHRNVHLTLNARKRIYPFASYEEVDVPLTTDEGIAKAEDMYQALLKKYPDADITVSVGGLY